MNSAPRKTLASADIADIAHVSRSAVSNWRNRGKGFPEPINPDQPRRPLFDQEEVFAWFEANGIAYTRPDATQELIGILDQLRNALDLSSPETMVLLLTAALKAHGEDVDWPERSSLNGAQQALLLGGFAGIDRADLPNATDEVLNRLSRFASRRILSAGSPDSRTSEILANLAASRKPDSVLDPACGIGQALIRAKRLIGDANLRTAGVEVDPAVAEIARLRGLLYSVALDITVADTLFDVPDTIEKFDVVIAEPPFSAQTPEPLSFDDPRLSFAVPGKSNADSAWPQIVLSHLNEEGTAFLIMSDAFLFQQRRDAKIVRQGLLNDDLLEAVISLGDLLRPYSSINVNLLVLSKRKKALDSGSVLFIDGAGIDQLEDKIAGWLAPQADLADIPHARIDRTMILSNDANLQPSRWAGATELFDDILNADVDWSYPTLRDSAEKLTGAVEKLPARPTTNIIRVSTIGELISQGVVALKNISRGRDSDNTVITPAMLGSDPTGASWPAADEGTAPAELSQPGDVLLARIGDPRASVSQRADIKPGTGVAVLRVANPETLDPHYLALMVNGSWNSRFNTGTTIPRNAIKDFEVPVVSLDQQQELAQQAEVFQEATAELARLSRELGEATTHWVNELWRKGHAH
ncbi:N-6 DNA methylase [Corynebacterium comes]|uniref:site-specific DNA-methyltransferase (adenine-specific) n=1 Tax=Corynebacterium comes TaxID=2675218 RepID=A0A6B8VS68_9CORY|nr:N-6 DNA methylase [Corynebacterium comes]QGU05909.1 putative type I restriction enzymeP M protein [Corynebacterium comes]